MWWIETPIGLLSPTPSAERGEANTLGCSLPTNARPRAASRPSAGAVNVEVLELRGRLAVGVNGDVQHRLDLEVLSGSEAYDVHDRLNRRHVGTVNARVEDVVGDEIDVIELAA